MDETKTSQEHAPGCFFCLNLKPLVQNIWSETTRSHFRNSRVEFLKGVRGIIDDRISNLSREENRGTRVTVE